MVGSGRYRRVLSQPDVAAALAPYVVARVASTMVLLALLLHVQRSTGSFVAAGAVTAAFATAVAVAAPVLGRLADRHGSAPVLLATGVVHPVALVALVWSSAADALDLVLPAAVLAGASVPPLAACMRALWPALVPDIELRPTAFSLEALVMEACELGGPLLVGALVVLVSPAAAVLVAAALSGAGTLAFALTRRARGRQPERRTSTPDLAAPLRVPGLRRLLVVIGASVAAVAALEVAVAGFATDRGSAGTVGWLLGAWVAGSLVAGWWFGTRSWTTPLQQQLPVLLLGSACLGLLPLLAGGVASMAALLVVAGLCLAPSVTVQFSVLSQIAADRRRTESFTWASSAAFLGMAVGNLTAGPVVEHVGWQAAVGLGAAYGAAAALLAWVARFALGMRRADEVDHLREDLAIALREREEALAALRETGRRADALRRELALLQQTAAESAAVAPAPLELPIAPLTPVERAEQLLETAGRALAGTDPAGLLRLVRLDAALSEVRALEQRRAAAVDALERLSAAVSGPPAVDARLTRLPRQRTADSERGMSFG